MTGCIVSHSTFVEAAPGVSDLPESTAVKVDDPQPSAEAAEEDEEAARRKRIAERMERMGGFNPFAGGAPIIKRRTTSGISFRVFSIGRF